MVIVDSVLSLKLGVSSLISSSETNFVFRNTLFSFEYSDVE